MVVLVKNKKVSLLKKSKNNIGAIINHVNSLFLLFVFLSNFLFAIDYTQLINSNCFVILFFIEVIKKNKTGQLVER